MLKTRETRWLIHSVCRSTILVSSAAQADAAESAIRRAQEALEGEKLFGIFGGGKIATKVEECTASSFFPAENYHKDYYAKNPGEVRFVHVCRAALNSRPFTASCVLRAVAPT